jgi:2-desacetyl-2-hydroxyethyl bacteriochlorophyllide A dehydrogenase
MRACQMIARGEAVVHEVADAVAAPGEALIRPTRVGICGTDLHILHDGALIDEGAQLPLTLGHEFVGEVVEGPREPGPSPYPALARPLQPGTRVTVEPLLPCGRCVHCLRGRPNRCARLSHLGIWRDGCMAELVAAPSARIVPIPDALDDTQAALVELYACAVNFAEQARLAPGAVCAVVGGGPVGIATAQCALAAGAGHVLLVEPQPARAALARRAGIDDVHGSFAAADAALGELTGGAGAAAVFECVGAEGAIRDAIALAGKGARVVMAGIPSAPVTLDWTPVVTGELELAGAFASAWAFDRAIALMAAGRVDPAALLTAERPLEEAPQALEQARAADHCKIHLWVG